MNVPAYLCHHDPNKAMVNPASRDLLAVASLLLRTSILFIQKLSQGMAVAAKSIAKAVVTR